MNRKEEIQKALQERILIIDGAMGTMIQQYKLEEKDYRGEVYKNWHADLKGNNDLLSITQPEIITEIHLKYLIAGADIIETNTFNAQSVSMADYGMEHEVVSINKHAVQVAKNAVAQYCAQNEGAKKWIAGAIGPMNKTLSISPDVNNPSYRSITFDEVATSYYEQIEVLVKEGVDLLLVETIFDSLNAKAAIYAIELFFEQNPQLEKLPVMISGTITDVSGRTLSGQTLEAFYISMMHIQPISIGLNCALGAEQMTPYIEELSTLASCAVSCYPNAGLPNAMGEYDETPEQTARIVSYFAEQGWVNMVGGCCGTMPAHIAEISKEVKHITPRKFSI
jgi:5-methyltetrahydrofolate--homocysteine methyltransferase